MSASCIPKSNMVTFKAVVVNVLLAFTLCNAESLQHWCVEKGGKVSPCFSDLATYQEFPEVLAARAIFSNQINQTGWAQLQLETNEKMEDDVQAYYAGYLEGFLTSDLIDQQMTNIFHDSDFCEKFSNFTDKLLSSAIERVKKNKDDPFWHEVGLTFYQIAGMDDGRAAAKNFAKSNSPHLKINPCGVLMNDLYTEFDDMKHMMNVEPTKYPETRCSAIVKILPDVQDVLVAHNTWANPKTMLRIMKKYTLNYSTSKSKSVSMSSYPGNIFSTDDFYITSSHLVVLETTNENYNEQLWKYSNVDDILFEFVRNLVANRLATDGAEWTDYFGRHNGGTYNNQFMVVDYKRFSPNNIQPGFLTIAEQLPGLMMVEDVTEVLLKQSYWPSYNIPYIPEIFNLSHHNIMVAQYGDFYSHEHTPRANIFRRDHHKVHNMTTLYHLMRYNNFKEDPLSRCNCSPPYTAEFSISARNDLNDPMGKYPLNEFTFRSTMAIDAKMTSRNLAKSLQMVAVSGPTNENLPTFSWDTTKLDLSHLGHPIEWDFKPIITKWDNITEVFPDFQFDF